MNANVAAAISFVGGMVVGFAGGCLFGKKRAEKKAEARADKEIREMGEHYGRKIKGLRERYERVFGEDECDDKKSQRADGGDPSEVSRTHDLLRTGTGLSAKDRTDYSKLYKRGSIDSGIASSQEDGTDPEAEFEGPSDEEVELERETARVEDEYEERVENQNRDPELISPEEIDGVPHYYQNQLLYFYPETGIMVDEDDHLVEDYQRFVGDFPEEIFGDEDDASIVIFVRSYEYDTIYEIQKMQGDDPITEAAMSM